MRGTRGKEDSGMLCKRIIPAHAGNTGIKDKMKEKLEDHPRACGEHSAVQKVLDLLEGSSPRMRGTPQW